MPQVAGNNSPFLSMVTMQLERMLQEDASGIETAGEQVKAIFPGLTAEQSTLIDEAVAGLRRREAGLIKLFPVPILSSRGTVELFPAHIGP